MSPFLLGVIGAIGTIAIFSGGFAAGWLLHRKSMRPPPSPLSDEPSDAAKKALDPLSSMLQYGMQDVYQIPRGE